MSRAIRPEFNLGLCAGSVEDLEALNSLEPIRGLAQLGLLRCIVCHLKRNGTVYGREVERCVHTGSGVAYRELQGLTQADHLARTATDFKLAHHTVNSLVMAQVVKTVPIPQTCAEV